MRTPFLARGRPRPATLAGPFSRTAPGTPAASAAALVDFRSSDRAGAPFLRSRAVITAPLRQLTAFTPITIKRDVCKSNSVPRQMSSEEIQQRQVHQPRRRLVARLELRLELLHLRHRGREVGVPQVR